MSRRGCVCVRAYRGREEVVVLAHQACREHGAGQQQRWALVAVPWWLGELVGTW